MEGHNRAFAYLGGAPRTILYDNTGIAVAEITGDGERKPAEEFSRLKPHYLFEAKFGRPGEGNDKGTVEGVAGYARRNFMVPVPQLRRGETLVLCAIEQRRPKLDLENYPHPPATEVALTRAADHQMRLEAGGW